MITLGSARSMSRVRSDKVSAKDTGGEILGGRVDDADGGRDACFALRTGEKRANRGPTR